jgi:hypothetical protein
MLGKKQFTSIIGLLILMIFSSCVTRYSYEYIDQETKDYCMFKKGSYWIYQDSVTNNIDSVLLVQSFLESAERNGEYGHIFIVEFYTGELCHYLSDTSMSLFYNLHPSKKCCFPIIAFHSNIPDTEKNITFCFSFENFAYSNLISYNIGSNIFNNVKINWKNNILINGFVSNYHVKYYWVKNIGIIRYEIYNSNNEIVNTYNLIRYNVKPYKK